MKVPAKVRNGQLVWPWYEPIFRTLRNCFISWPFWIADRLPWFVRKRLINYLADIEIMRDFMQADYSIKSSALEDGFVLCIKW